MTAAAPLAVAAGFLMGFLGSVPPAGPIAVLVLARGIGGRPRDGLAIAVGAALAESAYCALAVAGYGYLLERFPLIEPMAAGIGMVLLVVLGVHFLFARPVEPGPAAEPASPAHWKSQAVLGFSIAIANPVMLVTWSTAIAMLYAVGRVRFGAADKALFVAAAAAGALAWFSLLLRLLGRIGGRFTPRAAQGVVRAMGAVLVGVAALVARGLFR